MRSSLRMALVALVAAGGFSGVASAAFFVPDSTTTPFEDWNRTDSNSTYAEWNTFTVAFGAPGNVPDVGSFGPTTANLQQNFVPALITSGGNIYSFAGPTDFDVAVPNYGYGAGYNTRVAVQLLTLGNPLDASSMRLTYSDTSGSHTISPNLSVGPTPDSGGEQWLFKWDVANFNPASVLVEFNASASSMSLDRFVVDTFTQAVPEPSSLALVGLGLGGSLTASRLRRLRKDASLG